MSTTNQEIEAKFYVRDLTKIEQRLGELGAKCVIPRGFEFNLRFDDSQGSLRAAHKVLRLRQSNDRRLTYKGPAIATQGVLSRTEIELVVDSFENARQFLESLGYHVTVTYEKYRSLHSLGAANIALDELPYGLFVEIEAETPQAVTLLAEKLGLAPQAAIAGSYQGLFERLRRTKGLTVRNLSFSEFEGILITPEDLGATPAD